MTTEIFQQIRKRYMQLRPSERKVADTLIDSALDPESITIESLAQAAAVSQPTVIRFARAMGLEGFRELKTALLLDCAARRDGIRAGEALSFDLSPQDKLVDVPAKVVSTNIRQLQDTLKNLSVYELMRAVEAVARARCVYLIAAENSCAVAEDLATKLVYMGIRTVFYADPYRQSVGAQNLNGEDVAIAISYTGVSKSSTEALSLSKKGGAVTVAITNFEKAPINRWADIILSAGNRQYFYGGAIFSRCSQMAIVDMLYTGLLLTDYPGFTRQLERSSTVSRTFNLNEDTM